LVSFHAIWHGIKAYEIRKSDRDFQVGDALRLREYNPDDDSYTGREITAGITYITRGGTWGLPDDVCVMSIRVLGRGLQPRPNA
jgi:hypothetical protein